ncbi:MAG: hypothetical protein OXP08_04295 [bacterium]|nr:hypothetical protein [bacterium]
MTPLTGNRYAPQAVAGGEFLGPSDPNLVEGETYELKVWASAASSRDATFVVRRDRAASDAGEDDFILEPASIVIEAGAREGTATLKVVDDGLDERSESLVFVATGAGGDETGLLTFTLWDAAVRSCRSSPNSCWRSCWPLAHVAATATARIPAWRSGSSARSWPRA